MNKEEVDQMFEEAGISWDDFHEYFISRHPNIESEITREETMDTIKRVKEWKKK